MDMAQAATFLGASILLSVGILVLAILVIILNNLFSRFWKPVLVMRFHDPYYPRATDPLLEKVEPELEISTEIKPTVNKKV
jgi:hypothetical protein